MKNIIIVIALLLVVAATAPPENTILDDASYQLALSEISAGNCSCATILLEDLSHQYPENMTMIHSHIFNINK